MARGLHGILACKLNTITIVYLLWQCILWDLLLVQ